MLWALHTMTWRGDSFLLRRLTPKFQNPCGHYGSRIAQHSCWSPPNKELNESLVYSQCRWSSAVSHMTGPLIACFTKSPCARFRYNLSLSNKPKTETWSATSVQPSMPLITARDEKGLLENCSHIITHCVWGSNLTQMSQSERPGNRCVCLSWLLGGM